MEKYLRLIFNKKTICYLLVTISVLLSILLPGCLDKARKSPTSHISFEEVTQAAGFKSNPRASYAVAWGDSNGDSLPDVWINNHVCFKPTLYLNKGDGSFKPLQPRNVTKIWQKVTQKLGMRQLLGKSKNSDNSSPISTWQSLCFDLHGAAWGDFDNDGEQDLIQLAGGGLGTGGAANLLLHNDNGKFSDEAQSSGVDYQLARGRTPQWLDFDNDGRLDLFVGAIKRPDGEAPSTIFHQANKAFEDSRLLTNFDLISNEYVLLSDVSGDGKLDALFFDSGDSSKVIDFNHQPFNDLTYLFKSDELKGNDALVADLNGDLRTDLYLTKNGISSDIAKVDSKRLNVNLPLETEEKGFYIETEGDISFIFDPNFLKHYDLTINVGKEGRHPTLETTSWKNSWESRAIHLSSKDAMTNDILAHSSADSGIYIGYDPDLKRWEFTALSSDVELMPEKVWFATVVETQNPILGFEPIEFELESNPTPDMLLVSSKQGFEDQSKQSGIDKVLAAGVSVVCGDFDNDMDLDLYIVASSLVKNQPNILYENQGDGTFLPVPNAGGASGEVSGIGDSVTTVDYDKDGFLDLFVANGKGPAMFASGQPYQLFRNRGNKNHWLEIDLEGTKSNRDGIGARVFVTANGVTQLREQAGGMHNQVQNDRRIHFGLGDNLKIDEIIVYWPSEIVQHIKNISADRLIRIVESPDPSKS